MQERGLGTSFWALVVGVVAAWKESQEKAQGRARV